MYPKREVIICLGSSCFARGNKELLKYIQKYIRHKRLEEKVHFKAGHCFEKCSEGPNMIIGDKVYNNVSGKNIEELLSEGLKDLM